MKMISAGMMALVVVAASSSAQAERAESERDRALATGDFSDLDINRDGVLDQNEFSAAKKSPVLRLVYFDRDANGAIDLDEVNASMMKVMRDTDRNLDGRLSVSECISGNFVDCAEKFAQLDLNSNGYLEGWELRASYSYTFRTIDSNSDGFVTRAEQNK